MAASRKLQQEIERTLKRIAEGCEEFDAIWDKVGFVFWGGKERAQRRDLAVVCQWRIGPSVGRRRQTMHRRALSFLGLESPQSLTIAMWHDVLTPCALAVVAADSLQGVK